MALGTIQTTQDMEQGDMDLYKEIFTDLGISEAISSVFAGAYESGEFLDAIDKSTLKDSYNSRVHQDVLNALIKIDKAQLTKLSINNEGSNVFNVADTRNSQYATFNYYDDATLTYQFNFTSYPKKDTIKAVEL